MSFGHFSIFYVLRGQRTKGLRRRPFVNCWLINCTWDSALRPQTDSGLHAADRSEDTKLGAKLSKLYVQ